MSKNYTDQTPLRLRIEPDPWDLTFIFILQDIGLVCDALYPLLATAYMIWAWRKYKHCKHDSILLVTLWLFQGMIITRFL